MLLQTKKEKTVEYHTLIIREKLGEGGFGVVSHASLSIGGAKGLRDICVKQVSLIYSSLFSIKGMGLYSRKYLDKSHFYC